MRLARVLGLLRDELNRLQPAWALIGGLAVSVRAEPRTTRDVDVALAVADDLEAEGLVNSLGARGYLLREGGVFEQTAMGRMATVRLQAPREAGDVIVDLMFASCGIEREIVEQAEALEVFPQVIVPVARSGHLVAMKVLAGRPQDKADAFALMRFGDPSVLERAQRAVELIERRGFHRGRDLAETLKAWCIELDAEGLGQLQPR